MGKKIEEVNDIAVNEETEVVTAGKDENSTKSLVKGYVAIKLLSENELLGEVSLRSETRSNVRYNVVYTTTGNSLQDIVDECIKELDEEYSIPNTNVEVSIDSHVVDIIVEREKHSAEEQVKRDIINIKNTYINLLDNSILDLTDEQTAEVKANIKLLTKILEPSKKEKSE